MWKHTMKNDLEFSFTNKTNLCWQK